MKVYIVTSGYYEDYCIEEVFLDKEMADLYVKYHKTIGNGMLVEEYDTSEYEAPVNSNYVCESRYCINTNEKDSSGEYIVSRMSYSQSLKEYDDTLKQYNNCSSFDKYIYVYVVRLFKEKDYREKEKELRNIVENEAIDVCKEICTLIKEDTPLRYIEEIVNSKVV